MSEMLEVLEAVGGYFKVEEVKPVEAAPGVTLRLVSGEKAMLSFVTLQPGATVPLHQHSHEQLGTMIEGEMILYIGGMEPEHGRVVKPGDAYVIPGGTLHAATNVSDKPGTALDVFSPPRLDYIASHRQQHGTQVEGLK